MISKDTSPLEVYASEFVIDNGHLGFVATDAERNLSIFVYSPESKESLGGQRLIRKADIYIGNDGLVYSSELGKRQFILTASTSQVFYLPAGVTRYSYRQRQCVKR